MDSVVTPVYQPVVCMKSGAISFYEALARRRHGGAGHERLIALGEDYGFVHLIDISILTQSAQLLKRSPGLVVSVNVSALTIDRALGEYLGAVYSHLDIASRFIFEITETARVTDRKRLALFSAAVRLVGARVAIDDFGEGFATMEVVTALRPDFVKLPESAFARFADDPRGFRDIRETVESLGGHLVAEYVDSIQRVQVLRRSGVRYAQGYFFGMPASSPLPLAHSVAANFGDSVLSYA